MKINIFKKWKKQKIMLLEGYETLILKETDEFFIIYEYENQKTFVLYRFLTSSEKFVIVAEFTKSELLEYKRGKIQIEEIY